MSDGASGGEGGGVVEGAGGVADGAGGEGVSASWRDTLPDDLRGHASLTNFADINALAKGYVDTKAALTARTVDYSTPEGLAQFAEAVRPADAAEYEIPGIGEGESTVLADSFRALAHELGMPPAWTKATAEFFNSQSEAAISAANEASQKEVDTLKAQMGAGKYTEKLEAVKTLLPQMGVELAPEDLDRLDFKLGSGNLLKFMFNIADRVGDPAAIDGARGDGGMTAMTPDQANERWNTLVRDPAWRKQAMVEGTPEHKEQARLKGLIASGRSARRS